MNTPRPATLIFIWITVVLDMMAIGLIAPVLPRLVESMSGGDTVWRRAARASSPPFR